MTVNFEHLKPWESLYNDCRLAEKNAVAGSRAENILAMKSLGSALEKMVAQLVKKAGITDEMVEAHKRRAGKEGRADVYGRIMVLEDRRVLDAESAENYNTLRVLRNNAVHDENLGNASDARIQSDMEKMYRLMYEESYLFAKEYMAGSTPSEEGSHSAAGKSDWLPVVPLADVNVYEKVFGKNKNRAMAASASNGGYSGIDFDSTAEWIHRKNQEQLQQMQLDQQMQFDQQMQLDQQQMQRDQQHWLNEDLNRNLDMGLDLGGGMDLGGGLDLGGGFGGFDGFGGFGGFGMF